MKVEGGMQDICRRIESLTMRAWPAVEQVAHDGWLLRAANGYTGRANSVCAVDAGSLPLEEKIDHAEKWYCTRRLPPKFRLNRFSLPAGLDAALRIRGYSREDETTVMTCGLTEPGAPVCPPRGRCVELSLDEWFADRNSETGVKQGAILRRIEPTHWLLGWVADGRLVARVLGVLEDSWVGVFNLAVAEEHRRCGFGRALMLALLDRAREQGAAHAYLQMVADNAAALGLYTGLGFADAYGYWYRTAGVAQDED